MRIFLIYLGILALNTGTAAPSPKLFWQTTIPAYVTELEVAAQTGHLAITTIYDVEKSQGDNRLFYYNRLGKKLWDYLLPAQARTLEISADGNTVLLSLRNDTIVAISDTGKKLWERPGTCRPYPISGGDSLCFFDDDAESPSSVEWIDPQGQLKKSFAFGKETPDSLGFSIHPDQKSFLVWFPHGKISWQPIAIAVAPTEFTVKGSVIRAQFHPDGKKIEALSLESPLKSRQWTQWDLATKKISHTLPIIHAVAQWKWIGTALSFYGNVKPGQILHQSLNPFAKDVKWTTRREPRSGNYHALLAVDDEASQLITPWRREIQAISTKGETAWTLPETRDEGNFIVHLFADKISPKTVAKQLVVLGEENQIKVFSIP